ncbi:Cna B-type domain-containing protein [Bifidobacterium oedipodis]|nr:Cna B-type domain-containing protein [Bifidobacterium sp. DSM 109957]
MAALLASLLCVAGLGNVAHADDQAVTGSGSITFEYKHDGDPVPGVKVDLYRVATWSKDWQAQPTEDFKNYEVAWPDLTTMGQNELRDLANTLASYAQRDGIKPLASGETDANGEYTFSDLPDGLYLLVYGSYKDGDLSCDAGALLVSLPTSTDKDNTVEGVNVTVEPKTECETTPSTPPEKDIEIKVVKVWNDGNDSEHKRPSQVVVQLLRDGKVCDEVVLDESNNWAHIWTGLDPGHEWSVVEKSVPDGYTVIIDREGLTYTITNTYTPPTTTPGENPPSENPPTTPPSPDEISKTGADVVRAVVIIFGLIGCGVTMKIFVKKGLSIDGRMVWIYSFGVLVFFLYVALVLMGCLTQDFVVALPPFVAAAFLAIWNLSLLWIGHECVKKRVLYVWMPLLFAIVGLVLTIWIYATQVTGLGIGKVIYACILPILNALPGFIKFIASKDKENAGKVWLNVLLSVAYLAIFVALCVGFVLM